MPYKRILVPVDGSSTSAKGLATAIELCKETGAKLMLLHVVDDYPAFAMPDIGVNVAPMLEALRQTGRTTLEAIADKAKKAGVHPETCMVENLGERVADSIVGKARRWDADLIVMGTHGRHGVSRVLIGSVAEKIVRTSAVPVLTVH